MEIINYPYIQHHCSRNKYEDPIYNVSGSPKSVTVHMWESWATDINPDAPPRYSFKFHLNNGVVTSIIMYWSNGYVLNAGEGAVTHPIYDEQNRITDNRNVKFFYDDKGNRYTNDNTKLFYKGNKLKSYTVLFKDCDYDYTGNGILWYKEYNYNDFDQLITTYYYAREHEETDEGCITKMADEDLKLKSITEITRSYDDNNALNIILTEKTTEPLSINISKIIYNSLNDVIAHARFKNDKPDFSNEFEYVYDEKGNWVRLIQYSVHHSRNIRKVTQIIYREINY